MQGNRLSSMRDLLVREGLLTQEQVSLGLAAQKARQTSVPLEEVCVELGFLSPVDLEKVLEKYPQHRLLDELLLQLGLATEEQIHKALEHQKTTKQKIGEILVEQGVITEAALCTAVYHQSQFPKKVSGKFEALVAARRIGQQQLDAAIAEAREQRCQVEAVLMERYHLSRQEIGRALSTFYRCPFVEYDERRVIDPGLVQEINPGYLKANYWIPLRAMENTVEVLIDDPHSVDKIRDIKRLFPGKEIQCAVGLQVDILKYVNALSVAPTPKVTGDSVLEILGQLEAEENEDHEEASAEQFIDENDNAIVRLVNQIIRDAYKSGASDVHIEPYGEKDDTVVRFRSDGECFEYLKVPPLYRRALISRLKVMAQLDIAERRKPQDGKIRVRLANQEIELRMATVPTAGASNEDVVLRILGSAKPIPLDQLNMSERNLREFTQLLHKPYGLILCVGPTGSGKTTTLHSALARINTPKIKIWTVEDPVEITQYGLRQVQVNPRIGLDFATIMRAFLRADPDVIMVGEIRDRETAQTCIEASLTGHRVLSTLHTNSAVETVTRLLEIGMDSFNFADALLGVLGQRLARTICQYCKERYHPPKEEYEILAFGYGEEAFARLGIPYDEHFYLYRGKGCQQCHQTGYRGRLALHELAVATTELKSRIQVRAPVTELLQVAMAQGMTTLLQDGILKVLQGWTDYSQVRAVAMS